MIYLLTGLLLIVPPVVSVIFNTIINKDKAEVIYVGTAERLNVK